MEKFVNNQVNYDVKINNDVLERIFNSKNGEKLERIEMLILLILAGNGAVISPITISYAKLANLCGCSERGTIKAVERLQAKARSLSGIILDVVPSPVGTTYQIITNGMGYTIVSQYAYNRLVADLKNKEITPNAARLLCFVWRQVFGYRHTERMLTTGYIKICTGAAFDKDIKSAKKEIERLGYARIKKDKAYIDKVEQIVSIFEPWRMPHEKIEENPSISENSQGKENVQSSGDCRCSPFSREERSEFSEALDAERHIKEDTDKDVPQAVVPTHLNDIDLCREEKNEFEIFVDTVVDKEIEQIISGTDIFIKNLESSLQEEPSPLSSKRDWYGSFGRRNSGFFVRN